MNQDWNSLAQSAPRRAFKFVPRDSAGETLASPDRVGHIRGPNGSIRIAVRRARGVRVPHVVLAMGRTTANGTPEHFDRAIRIYDDLVDDIDGMAPVALLEEFANRFGLEFEVGGTRTRFMVGETITPPAGGAANLLKIPRRDPMPSFEAAMLVMPRKDGKVDVSTAFVLNTTAYEDWIRAHQR